MARGRAIVAAVKPISAFLSPSWAYHHVYHHAAVPCISRACLRNSASGCIVDGRWQRKLNALQKPSLTKFPALVCSKLSVGLWHVANPLILAVVSTENGFASQQETLFVTHFTERYYRTLQWECELCVLEERGILSSWVALQRDIDQITGYCTP